MELSEYKTNGFLHFIGCGGAGTRPLMKIFHELGFRVSGSDMAESVFPFLPGMMQGTCRLRTERNCC